MCSDSESLLVVGDKESLLLFFEALLTVLLISGTERKNPFTCMGRIYYYYWEECLPRSEALLPKERDWMNIKGENVY
jgi:hypothetical protein